MIALNNDLVDRKVDLKMTNNNQIKLRSILRLIMGIILFGVLGWIYFMGITCPEFERPFIVIYRGIGCGMIYLLYFFLIPTYVNKLFQEVCYSGAIVSAISFILTVILLFITFPLQI